MRYAHDESSQENITYARFEKPSNRILNPSFIKSNSMADSDIINAFNSINGKGSLDSVIVIEERMQPSTHVSHYESSSSNSTVKQYKSLPKTTSSVSALGESSLKISTQSPI